MLYDISIKYSYIAKYIWLNSLRNGKHRCLSGSLTRCGGENGPGIPGTCATRNCTYLVRGPWGSATQTVQLSVILDTMTLLYHWKGISLLSILLVGRQRLAMSLWPKIIHIYFYNDVFVTVLWYPCRYHGYWWNVIAMVWRHNHWVPIKRLLFSGIRLLVLIWLFSMPHTLYSKSFHKTRVMNNAMLWFCDKFFWGYQ